MKRPQYLIPIAAGFAITATIAAVQTGGIGRSLHAIESVASRLTVGAVGAHNQGHSADGSTPQSVEDFRWSGRIASDDALEIKGINGTITVEATGGSDVVVTAAVRARRSDRESVRVEMIEHAAGRTFCAVYPTPEGERDNFCAAGSDGRMSTQGNDVRVDFYVQVPAGVGFIGRTVNGDIEVIDIEGDVVAVTVNGDVDLSTTGFAQAETVNGSIDATMGAAELRGGAEFSTVNGSITLDLDDDVDANIDASWLNGDFESDLPFSLQGRLSRRSARGTLGDGGAELALRTVNGSIRIR